VAVHVFPTSPSDDEFPLVQSISQANIILDCVLWNLTMFPRSLPRWSELYGDMNTCGAPLNLLDHTRTIWKCAPHKEIHVGLCYFLWDISIYYAISCEIYRYIMLFLVRYIDIFCYFLWDISIYYAISCEIYRYIMLFLVRYIDILCYFLWNISIYYAISCEIYPYIMLFLVRYIDILCYFLWDISIYYFFKLPFNY